MMMQIKEKRIYTLDEYFEFEVNSEHRHEYINGAIIPMTGGTPEHNEIASILNAILRICLKGKPYGIFVADQRLWIPDCNLHTYPDVMVVPRPLQRKTGRKDTLTNPVVIAEVLSNSTKNYDRNEKFAAYRTLPMLQDYLMIDQYTYHVEHHSKTNAQQWQLSEYDTPESQIAFTSIPCEFILADLYEGIELGR